MRCRRLKEDNDRKNVVWFGSYGKNLDGTARFFNENDKHDNFSDRQQAVADSLTQHLSILRYELWYAMNYGLSLLDKRKSKMFFDAEAAEIILQHPDVEGILAFDSEKIGNRYVASMTVQSAFGTVNVNL